MVSKFILILLVTFPISVYSFSFGDVAESVTGGFDYYGEKVSGGAKYYGEKVGQEIESTKELGKAFVGGAEYYGDIASDGAKYYQNKFHEGSQYYYDIIESKFRGAFGYFLMEKPKNLTLIGGNFKGRPIYYVNGIMTHHAQAIKNAKVLAYYLKRPVFLLHNPSQEFPIDLEQCIYDRSWPVGVASWPVEMINSLYYSQNGKLLQANQTTRELSYILYHSKEPVSIVSHSQGTLITRNALLTVSAVLGKKEKMENDVYWAALGVPMGKSEVIVKPKAFDFYFHIHDVVGAIIGFNSVKGGHYSLSEHGACESYFPRLYNYNNDSNDFRLAIGEERAEKYQDGDNDCDTRDIKDFDIQEASVNYDSQVIDSVSPVDEIHKIYNKIWGRNATEREIFNTMSKISIPNIDQDLIDTENRLRNERDILISTATTILFQD